MWLHVLYASTEADFEAAFATAGLRHGPEGRWVRLRDGLALVLGDGGVL
jgi:hypothetical protein